MGDLAVDTEPLGIRKPGTKSDKLGNTVPTWDDYTETPVWGYVEQQVTSKTRRSENRQQKVTEYLVLIDHDVDVTADDRIHQISTGLILDVDGDPARCLDPDGQLDHLEIRCVKARG